ncbi:prepilin-type N-terminal cleavage/methylation domain-containing protein [Acinetobacter haemolyticus]|uniref:Prepilin-type N-terminal cleavage/methylation domain-containing protein n=2 Tax=Acinetobacter haemolyticus TaxID=29430 RepID=A0A857IGG0_ACIHA|nr:prepilin-type N-terminal cleavage/methylation domain-containing protein [Acinetobacter haemolyticus]QHI12224.1 prepilin-type N-terminal cleavage/methylation domain-containing protein [Acinetobacter haemolyticus]
MMKKSLSIAFGLATRSSYARLNRVSGFTLIELMVVVVVVAIIAAIAMPNYMQYMERRDLAIARQEALKIAAELERFKAKNFSYKGFDASYLYAYDGVDDDGNPITESYYNASTGQLLIPIGSTASTAKYTLTIANGGTGHKPLTFAKASDGTETADSASVNGLTWVMSVQRAKDSSGEPKQPRNYDLLLNSTGLRCMTKTKNTVTGYTNCGTTDSESW